MSELVKGQVEEVYQAYIKAFDRNPNLYRLTEKRAEGIAARLAEADIGRDRLIAAIQNAADDPWWNGTFRNDVLDYITKNYENAEKLANLESHKKEEPIDERAELLRRQREAQRAEV